MTATHQPMLPRRRHGSRRLLTAALTAAVVLAGCTGDETPDDEPVATDQPDDQPDDSEPGLDDPDDEPGEPHEGAEPAEQPLPTTTFATFPLDKLLTEYEVRVAEIIVELDGEVTDEGTLLTLEEPILFEFDSDVLKDTARAVLDDITQILDHYADAPIEVIGHTDDQGTADYNLDLSQRRADAVVTGLTDRGIDTDRMTAEGRGLTEPVGSNDTDEGRARNRRVEVLIVGVEPPEGDG